MTSRVREELLRRSCLEGWRYYLWAVMLTIGMAVLVFLTFRPGLAAIMADPTAFLLLVFCAMNLISFWRARPPSRKPVEVIRLNLE